MSISEVTVSLSVLDEHVAEIEARIRRDFLRRLHDFHISLRDNTLELEGQSNTYHVKQIVQKAVSDMTHLRIRANNIAVDVPGHPFPTREGPTYSEPDSIANPGDPSPGQPSGAT